MKERDHPIAAWCRECGRRGPCGCQTAPQVVTSLTRYDSMLQYYAQRYGLDWRMVRRQVEAESSFRPQVTSPAGAIGLMQFMPGTFSWAIKEMRAEGIIPNDYEVWIRNPEDSIHVGCWYDRWLYGRYAEIPKERERWRFALAAYNCGRANLNQAIHLARKSCGQPASFAVWDKEGRPPGPWQEWGYSSRFLHEVTGTKNASETIGYVAKIMGVTA